MEQTPMSSMLSVKYYPICFYVCFALFLEQINLIALCCIFTCFFQVTWRLDSSSCCSIVGMLSKSQAALNERRESKYQRWCKIFSSFCKNTASSKYEKAEQGMTKNLNVQTIWIKISWYEPHWSVSFFLQTCESHTLLRMVPESSDCAPCVSQLYPSHMWCLVSANLIMYLFMQDGNTPGQLAEQQENQKCAHLLQQYQARPTDTEEEDLPQSQYSKIKKKRKVYLK